MQLTAFEVTMALLGLCLSILACSAICGVLVLAERNRFDRYERLRALLQDICDPGGVHAIKLLAVHELRKYREYSGVISQALEKPAGRAAAVKTERPQSKPPVEVSSAKSSAQREGMSAASTPRLQIVPLPVMAARTASGTRAVVHAELEPFPGASFPASRVASERAKPVALKIVEAPKRDILDGVIIRERGRPVKPSVLREFLRFRDAITDRLVFRDY